MAKNSSHRVTTRAWHFLRLALLWARKGVLMELRLVPKFVKSLGHATTPHNRIYYQERELSFDKTPIIGFKIHRPSSKRFHIPCMSAPQVDFDYDFEGDDEGIYENDVEEYGGGEIFKYEQEEEQGIDEKAEEFISKFYQQMKLQRQISYLQYHCETPCKGADRSHSLSSEL